MKALLDDIKGHKILLKVVDGELKVYAGDADVDPTLISRIRERKQELIRFLSDNDQAAFSDSFQVSIPVAAPAASYPLSSSQKRLWVLSQFKEGNMAYNIPAVYVFEGNLQQDVLHLALKQVTERHEALRTVFRETSDGQAMQWVQPAGTAMFGFTDLRQEQQQEEKLRTQVREEVARPFNLATGPLIRAGLYQVADSKWVFSLTMHHIISDAWSMNVLIRELLVCYNAGLQQETPSLHPLRIQYKDYAVWQQMQLNEQTQKGHRDWWLRQMEGELPVLTLPGDNPRPLVKTFTGGTVYTTVDPRLCKNFLALCRQQGATLFMGLLAAVKVLLYRYTQQEDLIIGSSVAGRDHVDLEDQIGFYLNILPLRSRLNGKDSFKETLARIRKTTLEAYEHQSYPFDELINDLQYRRDPGRNPLFDVIVGLQHADAGPADQQHVTGLNVSAYDGLVAGFNKFDLSFLFVETGEQVTAGIGYNGDIYKKSTVERISTHLVQLLEALTTDASLPIAQLDYLGAPEKQQLLSFQHSAIAYPAGTTVVAAFAAQVIATPGHEAVAFEGRSLTYQQLDERSNQLAHYLQATCQIRPDDLVGIMLDRSEYMIIAMLGIMKAGAAYVAIEPETPVARKAFIMKDTGIKALITQADDVFDLDYYQGTIFAIDLQLDNLTTPVTIPETVVDPGHLAYVVYTSGSTGQPKGVMITHRSLVDYYTGILSRTNMRQCKRFGLVSTLSADLGNTVIFPSLVTGGSLRIFSASAVMHPEKIFRWDLDCIKIVPSHWMALQDGSKLYAPAKCLVFGGEALKTDVVAYLRHYSATCEVYNHYGPSEATVGKLTRRIPLNDPNLEISLGSPFGNTAVYILDEQQQQLPIGVTGEICIGGDGLAKGYLNEPGLTAEKFIPDPFRKGARIYRTGDLGKWLLDGTVVFEGRKDDQVKIRGYRIEPGEIENALKDHPAIETAVVLAKTNAHGSKELVAYLVGDGLPQKTDLELYLCKFLPAYAFPAYYVHLPALPLTPNGKIDRKRLPDPETLNAQTGRAYEAPRNPIEARLAQIWEEILEREKVGIKDNFFDLGGDSIKILRMMAAMRQDMQLDIPINYIYRHNTIEALVIYINEHRDEIELQHTADSESRRLVAATLDQLKERVMAAGLLPASENVADVYPMSDIERGMIFESLASEGTRIYHNHAIHQRIFYDFDIARFQRALELLAGKHTILRTAFDLHNYETEVQIVYKTIPVNVPYADLTGIPRGEQEATVQAFMSAELKRPFQVSNAPLWRMAAFNLGNNEIIFFFQCHHAIIDGWSDALLMTELNNLYLALAEDPSCQPVPLKSSYRDFIIQHELDRKNDQLRTFWKQELEDYQRLDLFTQEKVVASQQFSLDSTQVKELEKAATAMNTTVKVVSLAAYLYMLKLLNYEKDLLAGLVTNLRPPCEDSDKILGCFLNSVPLRMQVDGTVNGATLVAQVHEKLIQLKDKERLSMLDIAQIHDKQAASGNPFFDVLFDYVDFHAFNDVKEDATALAAVPLFKIPDVQVTNTYLDFLINRTGGAYVLYICLTRQLRAGYAADRIAALYFSILDHIIHKPKLPVNKISYLHQEESDRLLRSFNAATCDYSTGRSVVAMFEEQVLQTPEAPALLFEDTRLSYRELDEKANRLANCLIEQYAIQPGDLVGVMLDRSEKMIIGILGILKAGGAYVPVDPEYPVARKTFIINDTTIKVLLTQTDYLFDVDYYQGALFAMDVQLEILKTAATSPAREIQDNHPAYVIYTSGSTGNPKGVAVTHENLCASVAPRFAIYDKIRSFLLLSSIAFDSSVAGIFSTLCSGGRLCITRKMDVADVGLIAAYLAENRISHLLTVPSYYQLLVTALDGMPNGLEQVTVAGEACPAELVTSHYNTPVLESCDLFNEYGPTEGTVWSTWYKYEKGQPFISTIGRPVPNMHVYIFHADNGLAPVGVTGEICISGPGVTNGYLNNPVLTAEKFVPDPFREGARMYRTGDLGRWLPDGNIEFLGRRDEQVKVRGYRIEPAEIESCLLTYEGIKAVVVLARTGKDGAKELVTFFTAGKPVSPADLKAHISRSMPAYMLPDHYVQLDELPLNSNGKVDRKGLLNWKGTGTADSTKYVAPRNATEKKLVQLWQEILDKEHIGIRDSFFDLGGHSLKIARLANQVHKAFNVEIPLKDLFTTLVLEEQAALITQAAARSFMAITPVTPQPDYLLSSSQRRLWILSQFEESSIAYNIPGVNIFEGRLDRMHLNTAFHNLVARHESLRTLFKVNEQGEVRQLIQPVTDHCIVFHDVRQEKEQEQAINNLLQEIFTTPFDLAAGPLIHVHLLQATDHKWVIAYVMHHIVSDGWSMEILMQELLQHYNASMNGSIAELPPLHIQYKDYAAWQREQLNAGTLKEHKTWWLEQFKGELPVLALPGDNPRPAVKTYNGGTVHQQFNRVLSKAFKSLCREQESTLFIGLLAAVNGLLYRYTNQEDLILGTPVAGRDHADLESQVGFYINTLALRTRFRGEDSFLSLLANVKESTTGAFGHQLYPFDELVNELQLRHDPGRNALFDLLVSLQHAADANRETQELEGLKVSRYEGPEGQFNKFDLTFLFIDTGEEIRAVIRYNSDIYNRSTVERLGSHLEQLLEAILRDPSLPLRQLDYLGAAEKQQLLAFNSSTVSYPANNTIPGIFAAHAAATPDHVAVAFENKTLTYRQLDEHSNRLAHYLRDSCSIRANDLVGIMLDRSEYVMVAILGILKAGGAYVAIEPDTPSARKAFIISDTGIKALITQADYMFDLDYYPHTIFAMDIQLELLATPSTAPEVTVAPDDLAYVVYTSGSTGQPKGVMITHRSLLDYTFGLLERTNIRQCKTFGLVSTIAADLGNTVIYSSLLTGGSLRIFPVQAIMDPARLFQWELDCIKIVPSHWKALQAGNRLFVPARCLVFGGEQLTPDIIAYIRLHQGNCEVYNHYGPSETTIGKLIKRIDLSVDKPEISLGKPFGNTTIYILDEWQQLLPAGIPGEICIGGEGLSKGYLGRPALTQEKFVADPYRPGAVIYRTGDLGRWLPDGSVEFIGRTDDQVKIRGYRIELGEIENALKAHPSIDAAVVLGKGKGPADKELVAYIVSRQPLHKEELRQFLAQTLPAYMLPAYFISLPALPLTPNGKIDRKQLPDPDGQETGTEAYVAPGNETEEKLVLIWQQVLGKEKTGVQTSFFNVGGNSIRIIEMQQLVNREFGTSISIAMFFEYLTIRELAIAINREKEQLAEAAPAEKETLFINF